MTSLLMGILIGILVGVPLGLFIARLMESYVPNDCNFNCNQGRNCNCKRN